MIRASTGVIASIIFGATVFISTGIIGSSQASVTETLDTRACASKPVTTPVAAFDNMRDGATKSVCVFRPQHSAESDSSAFHPGEIDVD